MREVQNKDSQVGMAIRPRPCNG